MTGRTGTFADTGGALTRMWGGVLRCSPNLPGAAGTWQILGTPPSSGIADTTHQSSNLWTCTQDADAIYVTGPIDTKIITFLVGADETYSRMGYTGGASVVNGKTTILLTKSDPTSATGVSPLSPNDPSLVQEFGNWWLFGLFLV